MIHDVRTPGAPPSADAELVVLLDDEARPIGTAPKADVHTADTALHLAFSIYVVDAQDRLLVTRRATSKLTWPGVWTNSCCGHVSPGETPVEAARRRLASELGLEATDLWVLLPDFRYRATSAEGVVENEVCPVFGARVEGDPVADPAEVAEWQWSTWDTFRLLAERAPWTLSPWAVRQANALPASGPGR